jgi:hypothetical protein
MQSENKADYSFPVAFETVPSPDPVEAARADTYNIYTHELDAKADNAPTQTRGIGATAYATPPDQSLSPEMATKSLIEKTAKYSADIVATRQLILIRGFFPAVPVDGKLKTIGELRRAPAEVGDKELPEAA